MKKTVTANISGTLYNIEDDAFDLMQKYLNSIKMYFSSYEDSEEIFMDFEFFQSALGELFFRKLNVFLAPWTPPFFRKLTFKKSSETKVSPFYTVVYELDLEYIQRFTLNQSIKLRSNHLLSVTSHHTFPWSKITWIVHQWSCNQRYVR